MNYYLYLKNVEIAEFQIFRAMQFCNIGYLDLYNFRISNSIRTIVIRKIILTKFQNSVILEDFFSNNKPRTNEIF